MRMNRRRLALLSVISFAGACTGDYPYGDPSEVLAAGVQWECELNKACYDSSIDVSECVEADSQVPQEAHCLNPRLAAACRDGYLKAAETTREEGCDAGLSADPAQEGGPCSVPFQKSEPCGPL